MQNMWLRVNITIGSATSGQCFESVGLKKEGDAVRLWKNLMHVGCAPDAVRHSTREGRACFYWLAHQANGLLALLFQDSWNSWGRARISLVINRVLSLLCMNDCIMCRCSVHFHKLLCMNKWHHYDVIWPEMKHGPLPSAKILSFWYRLYRDGANETKILSRKLMAPEDYQLISK